MVRLGRLDKSSPMKIGILQAIGVVAYILIFASIVNLLRVATTFRPPEFLMATFVLLTFVFSALVCGSLVLGYPALLAIKGNVKRAVLVVAWTGASFATVLVLALIIAVVMR
jgi:hypothetical protein